jgi:pyruvate dehydrogenase complex dehydrogenase (E1) component
MKTTYPPPTGVYERDAPFIYGRFESIENEMKSGFRSLEHKMEYGFQRLDDRMDRMEAKFDARFEEFFKTYDWVVKKIADYDTEMIAMHARIDRTEKVVGLR